MKLQSQGKGKQDIEETPTTPYCLIESINARVYLYQALARKEFEREAASHLHISNICINRVHPEKVNSATSHQPLMNQYGRRKRHLKTQRTITQPTLKRSNQIRPENCTFHDQVSTADEASMLESMEGAQHREPHASKGINIQITDADSNWMHLAEKKVNHSPNSAQRTSCVGS